MSDDTTSSGTNPRCCYCALHVGSVYHCDGDRYWHPGCSPRVFSQHEAFVATADALLAEQQRHAETRRELERVREDFALLLTTKDRAESELARTWDRLNAERLDMCGKLTRAESALRAAEGEIAAIRRQITCEECGEPATALHSTEGDGAYWLCDSEDTDHMEKYCGCEKFRFAGTLAPLAPAPVEWDEQVFLRGDDHANETCLGCGKHISRHFGMTAYRCHPKAPAPVMSKSMQRRINTMEGREMDAPVTVAGVPSRAILERGVVEAAQQWGAADLRENVASYDATMRLLGALERLRDLDASADSAVKP